MINNFLDSVCNTNFKIISYSGNLTENGGPEILGEWIGKCNFQRGYRRVFSNGTFEDVLEGTLYIPTKYIKKNFQTGKVIINDKSYQIKSVIESFGIDGNVDFYIIKTM